MFAARRAVFAAPRRCQPHRAQPIRLAPRRFYSAETAEAAASQPEAPTTAAPPESAPESETAAKPPFKPKPTYSKPAAAAAVPSKTPKAVSANVSKPKSPPPSQNPPAKAVYQPVAVGLEPRPAEPAPTVDWSTSFYGIGAQPVSQEQFDFLMQPLRVEDIEIKPDGVIYLPEIKYRRKLNEAFGPMGWGLIPKGEPVVGESVVTREYALIADSRFVAQAQGENNYFGADQLPSAVEGCKSNALMRCCKDLGIGSELWDPHYVRWFRKTHMEEVWVEHVTTKKKRRMWYRKGDVDIVYPYRATKG